MTNRPRPLLIQLMVFLLLVALCTPGVVLAAEPAMTEAQAVELLRTYSIVRGDPSGSLNLDQTLTRAQAAALFVRSVAAEDYAKALADAVPFSDARGHWAAGEIAMAERLGLVRGDGDGNFRPDSNITYVEVLTVLLRIVKQEPGGPWQPTAIMAVASQLGLVPPSFEAGAPAVRGRFFGSLATAISRVQLPDGGTVLRKYWDSTPPDLSVDQLPAQTSGSTVRVSGEASGATRVTVSGEPADLNTQTGRFTLTADLRVGTNVLTVEAVDLAGNKASTVLTIERSGTVARIEVTGPTPALLRKGTSAKLTIKALDAKGNSLPLSGVQATLSGNVATFDLTTTTLTTGQQTGHGVLSLRSAGAQATYAFDVRGLSSEATQLVIGQINNGRAPVVNKETTVQVRVLDDKDAVDTDDYFRPVSLAASGLSGVSVTPSVATVVAGVATFTVRGTREGLATLTATSGDLTSATSAIEFLSTNRIVLVATPSTLSPDGTSVSTIRATLQDENGRTISNTSPSAINLTLTATSSSGELTQTYLTIPRSASSSYGSDGSFRAGIKSETATITGVVTSDQKYSVQTLTLPVTAALPGVKLQFTYPTTRQVPGGSPATVTVRVLDAQNRLVTAGSYAFQFTVSSTSGDRVTAGLPDGVELTFPGTTLRPVDDGRSPSDPLKDSNAVVGRTYQGTATLQLTNAKSGVVTLTPKLVASTESAYNSTSGFGPASGSLSMAAPSFPVTFAGSTAGVKLVADSMLGRAQPGGASTPSRTMTIRAQAVDATGTPIPGYSDYVTLTRRDTGDKVTSISGNNRKATVNGVAEFTVQASSTPGYDLYTASSGSWTSPPITLSVRNAKPDTPGITAIRGVQEGDLSPTTGYVGPEADYMDIQLTPQVSSNPTEPTYWVTAKVFRKGESTPFFTSGAIDLLSDLPVVQVPKATLRTGTYSYEVVINNAFGDSARSADPDAASRATNAVYNANYKLVSALYDAETGKLTLSTSGLVSGGVVDRTKLSIVKGDNALSLDDAGVTVSSVTSSSVTILLGGLADLISPDVFNGTVNVQGLAGWFTNPDGSQVAPADGESALKPMAVITHATLDPTAKVLYLYGSGFSQGTLSLGLVKIQQGSGSAVTLRPGSTSSTDRVTASTDSQITVALSADTFNALDALTGSDITVIADAGWLKVSSGGSIYRTGAIDGTSHLLYVRSAINSVQYDRTSNTVTLRGNGFSGATIHPDKLAFRTPGSTTDWRPSGASSVTVVDGNTITVQLSDTDGSAFESRFGGRNVFMNTDSGWLTDGKGRNAAPVPTNSVLFKVAVR